VRLRTKYPAAAKAAASAAKRRRREAGNEPEAEHDCRRKPERPGIVAELADDLGTENRVAHRKQHG